MNFKDLNIFYCILSFAGYTVANYICCPDGQVVIARRNVCWNPSTNVTSQISLKCEQSYRINRKYYTIEDNKLFISFGNKIETVIDE